MVARPAASSSTETTPWTSRLEGYALAARLSARNYGVVYSRGVIAFSIVPRVLLQVAFLSYLGYYAGGRDGRTFAFVGAAVQAMTLATVVWGSDCILEERLFGTLYRVRLGVSALPGVVAARWFVFTAGGFCLSLLTALILAVPFGSAHLLVQMLAAAPLLALCAVTTSCFGLAIGSFALTQRSDALIVNFAAYALLFLCGAVAPLSALGTTGSVVVRFLPLTNGLLAIRHAIDGSEWLGDALLEVGVGVCWALIAIVLLAWQERRGRRLGSDDLI